MKKTTFILAIFAVVCGVAVFSATASFQAFFSGMPTPIHPIVVQNTIYLPLEETASLLHLKTDVDLAAKRIFLEPESVAAGAGAKINSDQLQDNVILGTIETELNANVVQPSNNLKISLFKENEKYAEDVDRHAVALWISKNDPFYADTHGKVTDTTSDAQGHFAFSRIPPGTYEIFALRPLSSRQIGYWLIRLQIAKGQVKELSLDSHNLNRLNLGK